MTRTWLYLATLFVIITSCVPNRKLVYLQEQDVPKKKDIVYDSVVRTRPLTVSEYRIQPLDNLYINFETLGEEGDSFDFLSKLSPQNQRMAGGSNSGAGVGLNGVLVHTDGNIEYAVLGKIKVGGLTIFQAEEIIRNVASKFVSDVIVRVRLLNFRFTVLGEVAAEQTVVSSNTRLTMMEAIGLAGGLNELADRSNVKVLRQNKGETQVFYVNLLEEKYIESAYFFVQQNDVIIVPPLRQRPFRRYFTNNFAIVTSTITSTVSLVLLIITLNETSN